MANLDNFRGDGNQSIPQYVSTWTASATATGTSGATATHAGEASKSHYLCGIIASCDMGPSVAPESVEVRIETGAALASTEIAAFSFSSVSQKTEPGNGAPLVVNFNTPIQIAENTILRLEVDAKGMGSAVETNAFMWGFTNETRIE